MVPDANTKNANYTAVLVDYEICLQEIKPWRPSQSLRSLRLVHIQWENDSRRFGSTNAVVPLLGSEGKIVFNESFRLSVMLIREASVRGKETDVYQKNFLELHLCEPRRENTQLIATAVVDLAEYVVVKDNVSVSAPLKCVRSFSNISQPVLYLKIQPILKDYNSLSPRNGLLSKEVTLDLSGGNSDSALLNENDSLICDDASFHSSLPNRYLHLQNDEVLQIHHFESQNVPHRRALTRGDNAEQFVASKFRSRNELLSQNNLNRSSSWSSSLDLSCDHGSPIRANASTLHSSQDSNESTSRSSKIKVTSSHYKGMLSRKVDDTNSNDSSLSKRSNGKAQRTGRNSSEETTEFCNRCTRKNGVISTNKTNEAKDVDFLRTKRNSGSIRHTERNDCKLHIKGSRPTPTILDSKVKKLEEKIKMLEGELREAAAIESALYSVVAEHGSSISKVHAPARRLSRLYFHSCEESSQSRSASAARSAVSGLVLVAKACGNDISRLTFWLTNTAVFRAIVNQAIIEPKVTLPASSMMEKNSRSKGINISSSLKWKESNLITKRNEKQICSDPGDWEKPHTFISALEGVEAWIFSRIVESIGGSLYSYLELFQTFTPNMQSVAAKAIDISTGSATKKSLKRKSNSRFQDQAHFSLDLWKKAFTDAYERLCPLRAGGHGCACLPMLTRLIMEQCVARLDVAMFNAILRDSVDDIPTDPISDPITDLKVLPIPVGRSSFGAGAQLKNAIGDWSRWLANLFGIDDQDKNLKDKEEEKRDASMKSFHLLNALSDLMMLRKDTLLTRSQWKEVCPRFSAPVIKRILDKFVTDEYCPDPIPDAVFNALDSVDGVEGDEESIATIPCNSAAPNYMPPSAAYVADIIGELGSSVLRKLYTSDDELDELSSPLASTFLGRFQNLPTSTKSSRDSKAKSNQHAVRYKLLKGIWKNSK